MTLRAHHLGIIRVPLSVVSVGSKKPPSAVAIEAAARGPLVRFFQTLESAMDETGANPSSASEHRDPFDSLPGDVSTATTLYSETSNDARSFRIRFGKVGVLRDAYRSVFARNDGPVPAELRAFTRDSEPRLSLRRRRATWRWRRVRLARSSCARTWTRRFRTATRCA